MTILLCFSHCRHDMSNTAMQLELSQTVVLCSAYTVSMNVIELTVMAIARNVRMTMVEWTISPQLLNKQLP